MKLRPLLRFIILSCLSLGALLALLVGLVTQPLVSPIPSLPPQAEVARLRAHVEKLSVTFYPRSFEHPRNLNLAADYILAQFRQTGAEVSVQDYEAGGQHYRNIIARFGPKDGALLVVGAHYDAFDATPGADDNASGVAGLIELARLLGKKPQQRCIELVAYTLEEPPFFRTGDMGSARHAQWLRQQGREVELMLSLEMIGYFSDQPGSQTYPVPGAGRLYPTQGNFIALVGNFSHFGAMRRVKSLMQGVGGVPVYSFNAPSLVPGIDYSDQLNYWAEGYPALMVTDTAFNRYGEYHQGGDTWQRLDYARMAQVVQAVYAVTQGY